MDTFSPGNGSKFVKKFEEFHREKERVDASIHRTKCFSSLLLIVALVVFGLDLLISQWLYKVFLLEIGVLLLSFKMVIMIEEQNKSHRLQILLAEALEAGLEALLSNVDNLATEKEGNRLAKATIFNQ
ncbi:MAG: hypothetical protein PWP57_1087 [Candidatus Atribacteria bacterium]|nr:hypothetical protein [Candidatus Atribacteria bacterium]